MAKTETCRHFSLTGRDEKNPIIFKVFLRLWVEYFKSKYGIGKHSDEQQEEQTNKQSEVCDTGTIIRIED